MENESLWTGLALVAQERLQRLRRQMYRRRLTAVLLSRLPHIRYLTNFSGSAARLLITPDSVHFFTDDRYEEQVRHELFPLPGLTLHITREPVSYAVQQGLLTGIQRVGFQAESLSYATVLEIRRWWKSCRLVPIRDRFGELFISKAPVEVELIRRAAHIASQAYEAVLGRVRVGMSERELAAELSYLARQLGSEGDAFEIIVASGERGALPHGRASDRRLRKNELVTVDFGCVVGGYVSDMTRTFVLGRADTEHRRVYQVVWQAQEQAIQALRGGMRAREADAVARRIIEEAGFGAYFRHSLGHGIGRSVHEPPALSPRAPQQVRLPAGAVVTVEPGIYLPKHFGVRIEDDVHVGATDISLLTTAPRELLSV
ncbi:MAG: aminopeptidase P family protein [Bacteroidota bacterium]|nr:aminopeptidase P family protein [Bacteroidota bacterium]